jgi:peptidoglycan hydrolase-like protein with peptidoglycan-binding domain
VESTPGEHKNRGAGPVGSVEVEPRAPGLAIDGLNPHSLIHLQKLAGNASVAGFIERSLTIQRAGPGAAVADPAPVAAPAAAQGNPVAPTNTGTSPHPVLRHGSSGAAVEELQQKLQGAGTVPALGVDGVFGPATLKAVRAFQAGHSLVADGVVGRHTWDELDGLGGATTVGRVERQWGEDVNGQHYGMTSRFTWRLSKTEIRTTVKLQFLGHKTSSLVALWFDAIRQIWNRFKAVNKATGEEVQIVFDPQEGGGGADNTIYVHRDPPGNGYAIDAANWWARDPDQEGTAQHEFGHMIGLEDEYSRAKADYVRVTGEQPTGQPSGTLPNGTQLFDTPGIMGAMTDRHNHPIDPRHVREFVGYVKAARGGEWEAK